MDKQIKCKPTDNLNFDPYSGRIADLLEDLDPYLDEIGKETLQMVSDLIYKSGFDDGLRLSRWLER